MRSIAWPSCSHFQCGGSDMKKIIKTHTLKLGAFFVSLFIQSNEGGGCFWSNILISTQIDGTYMSSPHPKQYSSSAEIISWWRKLLSDCIYKRTENQTSFIYISVNLENFSSPAFFLFALRFVKYLDHSGRPKLLLIPPITMLNPKFVTKNYSYKNVKSFCFHEYWKELLKPFTDK